jgi:hypothetical protein
MKRIFVSATFVLTLTFPSLIASAAEREIVLPAGTILQCTLNEPNFSSKTAEVGDPVLCNLRGFAEFGQQAFPRGSYLVGHLEAAKEPGHFVGKGYLELKFDRIGLPAGDLPIEAKIIATRGYKVDKHGDIRGKGHAKRDVAEWMLPPLWPWKVIMLPARGPRPTLKGETVLSLRLMDDVQLPPPVVARAMEGEWHFFGRPQEQSCSSYWNCTPRPSAAVPGDEATAHGLLSAGSGSPHASYASYVSRDSNAAPTPVSAQMPVFVLKTGTVLAVKDYRYRDGRLTYTLDAGGVGVIGTDYIDWITTTRINNEHGIRLTLHDAKIDLTDHSL